MEKHFRWWILLTLLLCLCSLTVSSATALTTAEKEQMYANALSQLESILESSPEEAWKLDAVAEQFESLENYSFAKMLKYYALSLIRVRDGEYDDQLYFYLDSMKENERFISYLESLENSPIYSPVELENYILGRKAQDMGDTENALRYYGGCNGFYDSSDRRQNLSGRVYEARYDEAEKLMKAGKLAEAYALFKMMPGYKDSDEYVEYIPKKLGYDPLHEHEWKPATCTEPKTCVVCSLKEGSALGHSWDAGKVTTPATCVKMGVKTQNCTVCGKTQSNGIPKDAANHTGGTEIRNKKDGNCGNTGYSGDTYCKDCGNLISTGHVISSTGNHAWNSGQIITPATCNKEGKKIKTCAICRATETETIGKDMSNHTGGTEIRNKKEATCGKAGYAGDTYCKGCGTKIKSGGYIPATGKHIWDSGKVTTPATCAKTGVKTQTCTVCGKTQSNGIPKDAANHTGGTEIRNKKEATCGKAGYAGDTYCKGCGAKIKDGGYSPATGKHIWDSGKVTTPATCAKTGVKTQTCTVCGKTQSNGIPKDAANHTGGTEIRNKKEATCGKAGYAGDTYCKGCGTKIKSGGYIPATGKHDWQPATYNTPRTCKVCGKTEGGTLPPQVTISGNPRIIGSYVKFGHYPQTASGTDSTSVEWLVLDVKGNKALLISRYGLDCQPYNTKTEDVTWINCSLCSWLNSTFLYRAFTPAEQDVILAINVDNSKSQGYSRWNTAGGIYTRNQIFLLSYAEAINYFNITLNGDNNQSRVAPTAYAVSKGAYTHPSRRTADGMNSGLWWLRSPGETQSSGAFVGSGGNLDSVSVGRNNITVRPAFWLDLSGI